MPKTVLIADDSATIRQAFDLTFMGVDDIEIKTATSSAEAIQSAKANRPDLIIADSRFGEVSAYEFCRQIQEDNDLKTIPVWIMTGPFERLDEQQYDACGAEGHVRKPFDTQRMIDKVLAMSSPAKEEMARPSYPAATKRTSMRPPMPPPAAAVPKPPLPKKSPTLEGHSPPPLVPGSTRKATVIGGPVVHSIKPGAPIEAKPALAAKPLRRPSVPSPAAEKPSPPVVSREEIASEYLSKEAYNKFMDSLSDQQRQQFLAVISDVVEKVVWEVVPDVAEAIIKEELQRLLKD
ncbi:MAG: response regulator [Pseudomonadota bacterium]